MRPDVDRTLAALADPSRRAIVERLRGAAMRPSEVADALSLSCPTVSRHLRVLRLAGLVQQEIAGPDARARPIQLRSEPFAELRAWLDEIGAFWGEQLDAFKAHAERRHVDASR